MGVHVIEGRLAGGGDRGAWMVDSVTGWAFGPRFSDGDEVEDFLAWLSRGGGPVIGWDGPRDARRLCVVGSANTIQEAVDGWREEVTARRAAEADEDLRRQRLDFDRSRKVED